MSTDIYGTLDLYATDDGITQLVQSIKPFNKITGGDVKVEVGRHRRP